MTQMPSNSGPCPVGLPLRVTHAEMDTARADGRAFPLSTAIRWMACYQDAWWIECERGWLRILSTEAITGLDNAAARLTVIREES
jgi:hypothetical protein